jgi:hypothetical protein
MAGRGGSQIPDPRSRVPSMVWNASCAPTSQRRSVGRLCHPCTHPRRDSPQVGPVEGSVLSATRAADKVKTVVRNALLVDLERLRSDYLGNKPTVLSERLVGLTELGAMTYIIPPSQRQPSSNTSPNSRFSFEVSMRGYSGLAESKSDQEPISACQEIMIYECHLRSRGRLRRLWAHVAVPKRFCSHRRAPKAGGKYPGRGFGRRPAPLSIGLSLVSDAGCSGV